MTETFTVKVVDSIGVSDTQSLTITVNSAPTVSTTSLATATRTQTGYCQTLAGTGGTTPYAWWSPPDLCRAGCPSMPRRA